MPALASWGAGCTWGRSYRAGQEMSFGGACVSSERLCSVSELGRGCASSNLTVLGVAYGRTSCPLVRPRAFWDGRADQRVYARLRRAMTRPYERKNPFISDDATRLKEENLHIGCSWPTGAICRSGRWPNPTFWVRFGQRVGFVMSRGATKICKRPRCASRGCNHRSTHQSKQTCARPVRVAAA